jgi:predicted extracellular nuclease
MKKFTILLVFAILALATFAQAPGGWTQSTTGYTMTLETANVSEGSNAASITWTSTSTQKLTSADFDVTPGASYTISIDILDNTDAGRTRIGLGFDGASIDWNAFNAYSEDNANYQTLSFEGTVPDGVSTGYIEVRFYDVSAGWEPNGNQATNIIDNIIYSENGGTNLVVNGGFEDWETLEPTAYTIEQIQDTTGTGSDDSNVLGEFVTTSGLVTGIYGNSFTIQNYSSVDGLWSALWVNNNGTSISLNDEVDVTGTVIETHSRTAINATEVVVTGQPDIALEPWEISTIDANEEAYEAVFIKVTGSCTNENPDEGEGDFGEWLIDDESGAVRVNDLGLAEPFEPTLGFEYEVIGVLNFDFSNYKIEPRTIDDITLVGAGTDPILTINAPANGATLSSEDVNISFTVMNFDIAEGTGDGHIMYSVDGATAVAHYTTNPIALSGLSEDSHTVVLELVDNAGGPLDPAVTDDVTFTVDLGTGDEYTDVYDIQYTELGSGDSPLVAATVSSRGVVSAIDGNDFWMQDGVGAWNSIYIYNTTGTTVAIGDSVIVIGEVSEYYDQTQIEITDLTIVNSGNTVGAPTQVNTGDVGTEAYESVLVQVEGVNNNPPDQYGQWTVNDGTGNIFINDLLFSYTPTQGNTYRVTGICQYAFSEWKIEPRDANDIEDLGVNTNPTLSITSPANNTEIFTDNVNVAFSVTNFDLGTDGKVAWKVDEGALTYVTSSPINIGGLTEGQHTITLELVDMDENSLDPVVTASVNIEVNLAGPTVTPIYDIQYTTNANGNSPLEGSIVTVTGVVTANFNGTPHFEGYFVQDGDGPWQGLYIFDETNSPSIGDSIIVTGEIVEYFNMTEMKNIDYFSTIDIGVSVPNPIIVSTNAAATEEMYESVLVKVQNAECITAQDTHGEWEVNDGSGVLICKENGAFAFTEDIGTEYDITGVMVYSYGNFTLNYRIPSDIIESTGIGVINGEIISIYPNPASEILSINMPTSFDNIAIIDITGKVVIESKQANTITNIDISSLQTGSYFVKIDKGNESAFIKFVVE